MKKLCLIAVLAILITTVCKAQNPGGVPISILPAFTDTLKPADVFPIVHGGATRRATIAQLATAIGASGPVGATGATGAAGANGATGPTGDNHWTIADSLLYLNDTISYVGIGTNNPQYQLDVMGDGVIHTTYGDISNYQNFGGYGIPFVGVQKQSGSRLGVIGFLDTSPFTSSPADSSTINIGFSDFSTTYTGLRIWEDSSLTKVDGKLLNINTQNITSSHNVILPHANESDGSHSLILASDECWQDSGALNVILGCYQSAAKTIPGNHIAHALIMCGFGDSVYTYHEMMFGNQAYSNPAGTSDGGFKKQDLLLSIGNSTDAVTASKLAQQSCLQILKNGNMVVGSKIRYINSPDSAMMTIRGQEGNDILSCQDSLGNVKLRVGNDGTVKVFGVTIFSRADSVTIYALPLPEIGSTIYCTDCTPADNSTGGVKVCYNGSLWRREW